LLSVRIAHRFRCARMAALPCRPHEIDEAARRRLVKRVCVHPATAMACPHDTWHAGPVHRAASKVPTVALIDGTDRYIGLPDMAARTALVERCLAKQACRLAEPQLRSIARHARARLPLQFHLSVICHLTYHACLVSCHLVLGLLSLAVLRLCIIKIYDSASIVATCSHCAVSWMDTRRRTLSRPCAMRRCSQSERYAPMLSVPPRLSTLVRVTGSTVLTRVSGHCHSARACRCTVSAAPTVCHVNHSVQPQCARTLPQ
jgi:hypothetical protein